MNYSSRTSEVRRFLVDASKGKADQIGIFMDSNEEGARRFCYYTYRRGFGAKYMTSSKEGYEWFTYATYKGLKKKEIVEKILPYCKRKTDNVVVVDDDV